MPLGLGRVEIEQDIRREFAGTSPIDRETLDRLIRAVAEAIEKNNQDIERQLIEAGVKL